MLRQAGACGNRYRHEHSRHVVLSPAPPSRNQEPLCLQVTFGAYFAAHSKPSLSRVLGADEFVSRMMKETLASAPCAAERDPLERGSFSRLPYLQHRPGSAAGSRIKLRKLGKSDTMPPRQCRRGCNTNVCPQVCKAAIMPGVAPRYLGSASSSLTVSHTARNNRVANSGTLASHRALSS